VEAATALLTKFLAVEEQFAGKVLDEAMVGLVKVSLPARPCLALSCRAVDGSN